MLQRWQGLAKKVHLCFMPYKHCFQENRLRYIEPCRIQWWHRKPCQKFTCIPLTKQTICVWVHEVLVDGGMPCSWCCSCLFYQPFNNTAVEAVPQITVAGSQGLAHGVQICQVQPTRDTVILRPSMHTCNMQGVPPTYPPVHLPSSKGT